MPEIITYRHPHIEEAAKLAQFISLMRDQSYNLEPGTPGYDHMVEEILKEDSITDLANIIAATPATGFARVAETPDKELVGLGLGERGELTDKIIHLFVRPDFQRRGIASTILRGHQRWATRDQSAWVLTSNEAGIEFWVSQHFGATRKRQDPDTELYFTRMLRAKRRSNAT